MGSRYVPDADVETAEWGEERAAQLQSAPAAYNVSVEQANLFAALAESYKIMLALARSPDSRTPVAVYNKNEKKAEFLKYARALMQTIAKDMTVSAQSKLTLGLAIPGPRRRQDAPGDQPDLDVLEAGPTWVRIRVHGGEGLLRAGLPSGVFGAEVYVFRGSNPPADVSAWTFQGTATSGRVRLDFGSEVVPGQRVWVMARWFNRRGSGPLSMPVKVRLSGLAYGQEARVQPADGAGETVLKAA